MLTMDLKECSAYESCDMVHKCCTDCKTTKTPLWRAGPAGPKTLCNACGIRYKKRRASTVRMNKRDGGTNNNNNNELRELLKGVPAVLKKQRCQRKRKLGEVEEAAFCLMALSCGFVFA